MWSLILFIFISIHICASETICETPFHGNIPPMSIVSPFNIVTSASTVNQSDILIIKIKSVQTRHRFVEFMINARTHELPIRVLGRFISSIDNLKLNDCDGVDNTATYVSESSKDYIELQWQAPSDYVGEVIFKASIAHQDYDVDLQYGKNWVLIEAPVRIVRRRDAVFKLIVPRPNARIEERNSDLVYDGCGVTKTCFGHPLDCVQQQSCLAIGTAAFINNRFEFELESVANTAAYVTLALSRDTIMGEDSVMECVPEEGVVRTYSSWNSPRPGLSTIRQGVSQDITRLLSSSFVNGTIYCKLERDAIASKQGSEFNLLYEDFHFMLAIGSSVAPTGITFHNLGRSVSTQPLHIIGEQDLDPIYEGCGTTKTCFGHPLDCVQQQSCLAIGTAVLINNRFEFELESVANNAAYVALGLSRNTIMGEDSVMECVPEEGVVRTYSSWNTPRPGLSTIRQGVSQDITRLLSSSFVNGTIYCKLERDAIASKQGSEFNLLYENFHFMLAIGSSVAPTGITFHNLGRSVSTQPLHIIGERDRDPIYEGCGTTKTCFGHPLDCVQQQSCLAVGTAVFINNRFEFELESVANTAAYVAFALSRNTIMGEDSVMECVPEEGVVRTYSSWNTPRPGLSTIRQGVSQDITRLLSSSFVNGTIYCKLERDAIASKQGSEFNLLYENFHFMLAIGSSVAHVRIAATTCRCPNPSCIGSGIAPTGITFHNLGRSVSTQPLHIIGVGEQDRDPIYEGCGTTKTCFGFPTDCVQQQSCRAIGTAVYINNRFEFELETVDNTAAYVALALSRDRIMGEDSVMECVPEEGIVRTYSSWNTPRPNLNTLRQEVPQNITTLLSSSFVNGTIYCKLERKAVASKIDTEFNLLNENFYFMLAIGSSVAPTTITFHNLGRDVSSQPLHIIGVERERNESIYEECGNTKICFGLPTDCVEREACQAIVTAAVVDSRYQFELQSSVDRVAYIALALSRDNLMGDDSVIECVREGNAIRTYASWNTPRPSYANTRDGVQQNITRLIDSSFIGGTIYCKLEREPVSTILGNEFDLVNEDFHFLLAIGSNATGSSVAQHDLGRVGSCEPIILNGSEHIAKISFISIAVWFLATIYANYLYGP